MNKSLTKRRLKIKFIKKEQKLLNIKYRSMKTKYFKKLLHMKNSIKMLTRNIRLNKLNALNNAKSKLLKFNGFSKDTTNKDKLVALYNKKIKELKLNNYILDKLGIKKLKHTSSDIRLIRRELIGLKKAYLNLKTITTTKRHKQNKLLKGSYYMNSGSLFAPINNKRKLLSKLKTNVDLGYKVFYLKKINILSRMVDKKDRYDLINTNTNARLRLLTASAKERATAPISIALNGALIKRYRGSQSKFNGNQFDSNSSFAKDAGVPTFSYFSIKLAYLLSSRAISNPTINRFNSIESPIQLAPNFLNHRLIVGRSNNTNLIYQGNCDQTHPIYKFLTKIKRKRGSVGIRVNKVKYSSVHLL